MPSILRVALPLLIAPSGLFGYFQAGAMPSPCAAAITQPGGTPAPVISGGVFGVVTAGSVITIPVTGDKSHSVNICSVNDPNKTYAPAHDDSPTNAGLKIRLDDRLPPGSYYFTLVDNNQVVPGSVDVEPDKIKLIAVHPATAYRGDSSKFDFDVIGENFSTDPKSDDVTIEGQGSIVNDNNKVQNKSDCKADPCLWVESQRLMHVIGYRAEPHQGVVNIGIRVGNVTAADQKPLVLARLSGTVVFILSAALSGVLFWVVAYIVGGGLAKNKVGLRRLNLLQTFILDPQTNSYSLSKFQLLAFSATFIFGYLYVLLSRWLVQWQFSLPDVPSTIAGLLGISGGTSVASAGLTASLGSKGAGLQQPTGADLISSGGVVIPERFQFFVWTIVACAGFIALLVGQDPAKVSDFPTIPTGLLYVMGVSAAGYLGGKAARNPGPVVENIGVQKADADTPWPTLILEGQNLASNGRYFIDEKELGFVSDADKAKFPNLPDKLITPTPQPGAADGSFCKQLEIIIANSSIDLTQGDHTFRIVNQDGQFADISFTADQPSITAVYQKDTPPAGGATPTNTLQATEQAVTVAIKGSGLAVGSQVSWKAPGASKFDTQALTPGSPANGAELWVSLVPGLRVDTTGTINVTTPKGFVATAAVKVVAGSDGPPPAAPRQQAQPAPPPAAFPHAASGAGTPAPGPAGDADPGAKAPAPGPQPA